MVEVMMKDLEDLEFSDYKRTGPNITALIVGLSPIFALAIIVALAWWALSRVPVVVTW